MRVSASSWLQGSRSDISDLDSSRRVFDRSLISLDLSSFNMPNVTVTKRKMTAWKQKLLPLDVDLKICSKLSHVRMHRDLAMAAKQAAPSQKHWTLFNSMEILTMISAWKLLRVLNNCGHSDRIESLLYNPTDQPGLSDPLSNDPMPDSNFFPCLLTMMMIMNLYSAFSIFIYSNALYKQVIYGQRPDHNTGNYALLFTISVWVL